MLIHTSTLKFTTPAFLGNAEQSGQWRTPPFKAQLRQWWRVAYAAEDDFEVDVSQMRLDEGELFGNAFDHATMRKSLVRIRLSHWSKGKLTQNLWNNTADPVLHPEVNHNNHPVAPNLYLGYGPVTGGANPTLKANAAIQAQEAAELLVAVPVDDAPLVRNALWLMDRYGTVGGRSRNGWGSYELSPIPPEDWPAMTVPLRAWTDCLDLVCDWPHAIGKDDNGPLIWKTAPHNNWQALMRTLAIIKIGLRTQFVFPAGRPPHANALPRHWLSYPITSHETRAFSKNARLPNQLRFKVRSLADGQLEGVIFHMPHVPPAAITPNPDAIRYALSTIQQTWTTVHQFLDELTLPVANRQYLSIINVARRNALQPQLNAVEPLTRIPA